LNNNGAEEASSMTLDTIIHAGLTRPRQPVTALVLMGGGARTAYQAGVLQALAAMLRMQPSAPKAFPFRVLVGTSAGALNAAYLAASATAGLEAFDRLAAFWRQLHSQQVYRLNLSPLAMWAGRLSRIVAALSLVRHAGAEGALLDNMPLVNTLHRAISLQGIEDSLQRKVIDALAVTASSYTSGVHWTFCHTARDAEAGWRRPGRRSDFQPITIEHLMASSAIPFLFPATPLWVDGQREFFGDGSMRQVSPLSPAVHLGAHRVLVVGVGQPQRSSLGGGEGANPLAHGPSLGSIAGHAMASVFHDTLMADVEQAQRLTKTLEQLPREVAAVLPYRNVQVLSLQPSQSLDALAQEHARELPAATRHALAGLGGLRGNGAALASYLLFEPPFVKALIDLGEQDAYARKAELLTFLQDGG
jgi:NTE family protein